MLLSGRPGDPRLATSRGGSGALRTLWLAGLLSVVAAIASVPAWALDVPHLAAMAKPSVVLVTLYDERGEKVASGSGFFISADGRLVTNHHVIEGAVAAKASLSDGREVAIKSILADDPEHDIAVVQCEGSGYPALSIGDTSTLHMGDDVVVVGSPLGLSTTVSSGIVAAVRDKGLSTDDRFEDDEERHRAAAWGLQITAPVSHGSSGSPILNAAGEVVGVAVAVLGEGENINFGVPTVYVKAAIAAVGKSPPHVLGGKGSERRRNLLISVGLVVVAYLGYLLVTRVQARRDRARREAVPRLRH